MNDVRRLYAILTVQTALFLLIGLTISTQWFAVSADYHPLLGDPWKFASHSIYPPWAWFGWALEAIPTNAALVLKTSLPLVVAIGLVFLKVLRALATQRLLHRKAETKAESNRVISRIIDLKPNPQSTGLASSLSPEVPNRDAYTPSDDFTEQLSLADIEEIADPIEVQWPEDNNEDSEDSRTYRADSASYVVLQHLSAHQHEDVTTKAPAGFTRDITDETPRVDDPINSIPTGHLDALDEDEAQDEPTICDKIPSFVSSDTMDIEVSNDQIGTDKKTIKMSVASDKFFPRPRDGGLHIGEEQPDWAYSIATMEAPFPAQSAQIEVDSNTEEGNTTSEDSDSTGWTI